MFRTALIATAVAGALGGFALIYRLCPCGSG